MAKNLSLIKSNLYVDAGGKRLPNPDLTMSGVIGFVVVVVVVVIIQIHEVGQQTSVSPSGVYRTPLLASSIQFNSIQSLARFASRHSADDDRHIIILFSDECKIPSSTAWIMIQQEHLTDAESQRQRNAALYPRESISTPGYSFRKEDINSSDAVYCAQHESPG